MESAQKLRKRCKNLDEIKKIKPPLDPELIAIREQQILPAIKDLQSCNLETISSAVDLIINLIQDCKSRKLLLKDQIVQILLGKIISHSHSNLGASANGWNILKSLAQKEEADFCVHLYRQDILVVIDSTIKTIIQTIQPQNPTVLQHPQPQENYIWNVITSIICLLKLLSESQDEIAKAIAGFPTISKFLFGLLDLKSLPPQIQHEALSCLIAMTEENTTFVQQIVQNDNWLKNLGEIRDSYQNYSVYACAVLHNIFDCMQWFDHNTPVIDMADSVLTPVVTNFIEQSIEDVNCQQHSSIDQVSQLALEVIGSIATRTQEAIKHANKYNNHKKFSDSGDESSFGDTETKIDNISQKINEEDSDTNMECITGDESNDDKKSHTKNVTLNFLICVTTSKILRIFQSKINFSDSINEHVLAALGALNNIAWTVSNIHEASLRLENLENVWASKAQDIWDLAIIPALDSCKADFGLASLITSLAWAIARSVKGVIKLLPSEQQKFVALFQASKSLGQTDSKPGKILVIKDPFQGLGVKCIGVLGNLAREPASIELNRQIGRFLIDILIKIPDLPPAEVIESLNQIFEIYSDGYHPFDEPVFWGDDFYSSLNGIQLKLKKMAKAIDRRKFAELRAKADESVLNLGLFLEYKRKERTSKMVI